MRQIVVPDNYVSTTITVGEKSGDRSESKGAKRKFGMELWTASFRYHPETGGGLELAIQVGLNNPVYYSRRVGFAPIPIEEILTKIPVHLIAAAAAADAPLLEMGMARAPFPSTIATPGGLLSCMYVPWESSGELGYEGENDQ